MDASRIREAASGDVTAMLTIYELGDRASDEAFTVEEGVAHLARMQQNPALRVYVACDGDVVVGIYELLLSENMAKRGRRGGRCDGAAGVSRARRGQGD